MKKVVFAVDPQPETLNLYQEFKKHPAYSLFHSGVEVNFVHFFEIQVIGLDMATMVYPTKDQYKEIASPVKDSLEKLGYSLFPRGSGVNFKVDCFFDLNPKEQICHYLQDHKVDLVVVATRGKKGIPGLFDSSFAQYLLKHSPADVLILRPS